MDRDKRIEERIKGHTVEADLAQTPEYMIENEVKDFMQLALHGVKLGGRAVDIPSDKVTETRKSGWPFTSFVHCADNTTFKVIGGMVVEFSLPGEFFADCNLGTETEVIQQLGRPDEIRETVNGRVVLLKHLIYKKKHLVLDLTVDGRLLRVHVRGKREGEKGSGFGQ